MINLNMSRRAAVALLSLLFALSVVPQRAAAEVFWTGDFEGQDLSQFNYKLNAEINGQRYINIVESPVTQGRYAAKIELHDDARWSNGLRRVELQHSPPDARTAEGSTTYFAWSFYLPQSLSVDPSQQIGYWESKNSYKQMMAFQLRGDDLTFYTRQPSNVKQWEGIGAASPGQWHRVAMKIVWSKDESVGKVSLWFDGQQVVNDSPAKTLNDDNGHFTQIGILRGDLDFTDVPTIYVDDAVEGSTLEDVRPMLPMEPVMEPEPVDMGQPMPDMAMTVPDMATQADMSQPPQDMGAMPPQDMGQPSQSNADMTASADQGAQDHKNLDGVGCAQSAAGSPLASPLLVLLLGGLGLRRRRATRRA